MIGYAVASMVATKIIIINNIYIISSYIHIHNIHVLMSNVNKIDQNNIAYFFSSIYMMLTKWRRVAVAVLRLAPLKVEVALCRRTKSTCGRRHRVRWCRGFAEICIGTMEW